MMIIVAMMMKQLQPTEARRQTELLRPESRPLLVQVPHLVFQLAPTTEQSP